MCYRRGQDGCLVFIFSIFVALTGVCHGQNQALFSIQTQASDITIENENATYHNERTTTSFSCSFAGQGFEQLTISRALLDKDGTHE
jgi:hypothetical protein